MVAPSRVKISRDFCETLSDVRMMNGYFELAMYKRADACNTFIPFQALQQHTDPEDVVLVVWSALVMQRDVCKPASRLANRAKGNCDKGKYEDLH